MKLLTVLLISAILFLTMSILPDTHAEENQQVIRYVPAEIVSFHRPNYPSKQIKLINSGMVELAYMIDSSGKTGHIMVLASSHKDFESKAIFAVSKYSYKPALYHGKPGESFSTIRILFEMEGIKNAVTPKFAKSFYKIQEMFEVESPDQQKIREEIDELIEDGYLGPYVRAQLGKIEYLYAARFQNLDAQIKALEEMLLYQGKSGSDGKYLNEETAKSAYINLFNLYINKPDYGAALRIYYNLMKIDPLLKDKYARTKQQIDAVAKDNLAFATVLEIGEKGYTHTFLFHKSFSFYDVVGEISSLKVRCDRKYFELEFSEDAGYKLPKTWGNCHLQILGNPGTKLELLQGS